jgi:hypothetical protein
VGIAATTRIVSNFRDNLPAPFKLDVFIMIFDLGWNTLFVIVYKRLVYPHLAPWNSVPLVLLSSLLTSLLKIFKYI